MRTVTAILVAALAIAWQPNSIVAQSPKVGYEESELKDFVNKNLPDFQARRNQLIADIEAGKRGGINSTIKQPVNVTEVSRGRNRYLFKSAKDKEAAIATLEGNLGTLNNGKGLFPSLEEVDSLRPGLVGTLSDSPKSKRWEFSYYRVDQIIDANSMLIDWTFGQNPSGVKVGNGPIKTVPGDEYHKYFWLTAPTQDLVDGKIVQLAGVYKVTGTKRYQTNAGSNTVFEIKKMDVSGYVPPLKQDFKADDKPKPNQFELRKWSDKTGQFSIEARFKSAIDGKVSLEKPDGSTSVVPIEVLSDGDRQTIAGYK